MSVLNMGRRRWLIVALTTLALSQASCGDDIASESGGGANAGKDTGGGNIGDIADDEDGGGVVEADSVSADDGGGVVATDAGGLDGGATDDGGGTDGGGAADSGVVLDCPGGAGCPCANNDECDNALCIDGLDGKACAMPCTDTCPAGQACKEVGKGGDTVFACVSNFVTLCAPCAKDADCQVNGIAALCIDGGAVGHFCGGPCADDDDCPSGYACGEAKGTGGSTSKQCALKDAKVCGCSKWAIASGLKTSCSLTNGYGTCSAQRGCTESGLEPCAAAVPEVETCNTVDDDCNGVTDDLAANYKCSNKAFADLGSAATCTTDDDCSVEGEKCNDKVGLCKTLIGECFGTPSCTSGGQLLCNGAKEPKAELCNLEDDDCDGKVDEDYGWQGPDGVAAKVGEACGYGACANGKVVCDNLSTAVCDSADKKGEEKCDGTDGDCDGTVDNPDVVCDDGDECTDNVCDGANKACSNPANVTCDDNNPCTADSCDKAAGKCVNAATTAICDDGNACTVGDVCGQGDDGSAVCLAGATTQLCDDSNICTNDSCAPDKGCVNLANTVTETCYGGKAGTAGVGLCSAGVRYCAEGKLGDKCVNEVLPALTEKCDGLDEDCDGVKDNGCTPTGARLSFANSAATVKGQNQGLRMRLGGNSTAGRTANAKHTAHLGFYGWLRAFFKP